jgi:hypothetical protein
MKLSPRRECIYPHCHGEPVFVIPWKEIKMFGNQRLNCDLNFCADHISIYQDELDKKHRKKETKQ